MVQQTDRNNLQDKNHRVEAVQRCRGNLYREKKECRQEER